MAFTASVLTLLLLLSAPAVVRAQPATSELDRNTRAVTSGQHGLEAFRREDWAQAYALFHEAETFAHSPVFLLYMARARERQGASAEALDLYARLVREPLGDDAPDSWRSAVEQAVRESKELRSRLTRRLDASRRRGKKAPAEAAVPSVSRKAALVAGGIGLAGLAVGAIAGVTAWIELEEIRERCKPRGCDPRDKRKLEAVETWSRLADLGFVVGGTGIATSAVFFWVVPAGSTGTSTPVRAGFSAQVSF